MGSLFNSPRGKPWPKLFGDDSAVLRQLAAEVAVRLKTIDGVVEVFNGITIAGDAIEIRVDRIKAALEGLARISHR